MNKSADSVTDLSMQHARVVFKPGKPPKTIKDIPGFVTKLEDVRDDLLGLEQLVRGGQWLIEFSSSDNDPLDAVLNAVKREIGRIETELSKLLEGAVTACDVEE